ncbi:MAG: hypothetical protein CVU91_13520 [Firmicutes bacterium HGW-Firmicutes-16]|nr:MAG: hypothetical protein CVU91_13520 [Firmicutes bacterium HGW-Firmicutes-16]
MNCINKKCSVELPDDAVYCLKCGRKQIREAKQKLRGNGEGTVYRREGNTTWTAEVTIGWKKDKNGKRRRVPRTKGGFATKKEALDFLPELRRNTSRKTATLEKLYDGYESSPKFSKLSSSKQSGYRSARKRIDDIAYIDINALNIEDLQDCVDRKSSSFYTAKDMKVLMSHLYSRAVAQGDTPVNLAKFIELPELDEKETVPFSRDEQAKLWEDFSVGNKFPGLLLLMIHTGMMPGELFKSDKTMIDWDAQQINGCGMKTKKRKTTPIIIPDLIIPVLEALCNSDSKKICEFRREDFYDIFPVYIQLMGFNPELRPYSCRHSAATALDKAGIAPTVIQEIMRHSRFASTERYIHKDTSAALEEMNRKIKKPTTV